LRLVRVASKRHPMMGRTHVAVSKDEHAVHEFRAEHDEDGVFFYQAFKDEIADFAIQHQRFGGPDFNPSRMTWIKPSFGWVLYRSGYARKHHQNRILKVKVPHDAVADMLSKCACRHGGGGTLGRVQWDPERDLWQGDGSGKRNREPRKMRVRAIQMGVSGHISEQYVHSIVSIEDVTQLAQRVGLAHESDDVKAAMADLRPELPRERPYMPLCSTEDLIRLHLRPEGFTGGSAVGLSSGGTAADETLPAPSVDRCEGSVSDAEE